MRSSTVLVCLGLGLMSSVAHADGGVPTGGGLGLRNGFSLNAGIYRGSIDPGDIDISATMIGADWRIGLKLTPAIALYLNSHLSLGPQKVGAQDDIAANIATAAIFEYTLPQRVFFGAGAGFGIVDDPSGPMIQVRAGWYPMAKSFEQVHRRLNVAFDLRYFMLSEGGQDAKITQVSLSIGYDRF
jgi:hypothetical protein